MLISLSNICYWACRTLFKTMGELLEICRRENSGLFSSVKFTGTVLQHGNQVLGLLKDNDFLKKTDLSSISVNISAPSCLR